MRFELNKNDIEALHYYMDRVQPLVDEFYTPDTMWARPEVIENIRQDKDPKKRFLPVDQAFHVFEDPERGWNTLLGNVDLFTDAIKNQQFTDVSYYARGDTAVVFVGLKDSGESAAIRAWTYNRFAYERFDKRPPENPTMLPPDNYIMVSEEVENWVSPFLKTLNLDKASEPLKDVSPVYSKIFRAAGMDVVDIRTMGVLPDGRLVHIDPHDAECSGDLDRMREQFASYKVQTKNYPKINHLFDYF